MTRLRLLASALPILLFACSTGPSPSAAPEAVDAPTTPKPDWVERGTFVAAWGKSKRVFVVVDGRVNVSYDESAALPLCEPSRLRDVTKRRARAEFGKAMNILQEKHGAALTTESQLTMVGAVEEITGWHGPGPSLFLLYGMDLDGSPMLDSSILFPEPPQKPYLYAAMLEFAAPCKVVRAKAEAAAIAAAKAREAEEAKGEPAPD